MSLWVGDQEVGLAPGQTEGDVGGTYVVRDPSSDITKPYIEATDIQTVTVPTGGFRVTAGGKTYYTKEVPEIGYYRPETGYRSVRRTDIPTKEEIEEQYQQQVASGQIIPNLEVYRKEALKLEAARKSLIEQGYKPYVTIEGTTLYTKGEQKKEIIVPKYGKLVQRGERTEPYLGVFTPDKFIDEVDNTQRKISLQIERLDKEISEKYGLPEKAEKAIKTYRRAQLLAEKIPRTEMYGGKQKEIEKAIGEFAIGFTEELAQKPVTAAGNALFALLVTKGIGGIAAKAPILTQGIGTGKIASKVNAVNILGTGLATMYGIDVTQRAIVAEDKARFAGQITATEILPFAAGGYFGTRKIPSIPAKAISRRAEITYLKVVREGKILQAKTTRDFETFINDEAAELLKRKKKAAETITVQKPEVAKKAEEVEVIRADIELEKQLKAKKVVYEKTFETQFEAEAKAIKERIEPLLKAQEEKYGKLSGVALMKAMKAEAKTIQKQTPLSIQSNIQKATTILKSEAITKAIQNQVALQKIEAILKVKSKAVALQKSIAVQTPIAIQKSKVIQETKNIQTAEEIIKTKAMHNNFQIIEDIFEYPPVIITPIIQPPIKEPPRITKPPPKFTKEPPPQKPPKKPPPEEYLFRKPPPPKRAKKFIEAINERAKRNKKKKWIWDVNNPVPTLEEIIS